MIYVDSGNFEREEAELGEAKLEKYRRCSHQRHDATLQQHMAHSDDMSAESILSKYSLSDSVSASGTIPPVSFLQPSGTLLKRPLNSLVPDNRSVAQMNISPKARKLLGVDDHAEYELANAGTINPTESEWMRRTPSPVRQLISGPVRRAWSPRPSQKRSGKSFLAAFRHKDWRNLSSVSMNDLPLRNHIGLVGSQSTTDLDTEVKGRTGNWI